VPRLLARSQVVSPAKPALTAITVAHHVVVDGREVSAALVRPQSLAYEVLDLSDAEKENDPEVVVPRTTLNLTTSAVGFGRYAPTWTVPANESLGRHMVRWFATMVSGGPEVEWTETFDVVASTVGLRDRPLYATVSDVRAEGAPPSMTDRWIAERLISACDRLDRWTGRTFAAEWKKVAVDGDRNRYLYLQEPIVALERVVLSDGVTEVEPSAFVVYNRHVAGLLVPDDRESPRIEFMANLWETRYSTNQYRYPGIFSDPQWAGRTPQTIAITGIFGYTDPDGTPTGSTPSLAREVVVGMAVRELPKQGSATAAMKRREGFITMMKTREQTVQYGDVGMESGAAAPSGAAFTGDPHIDGKIAQLCPAVAGGVV
jgi:hypothetical protein